MIYFLPLGGAGEIGANCYYLNIDNTGIILDCGMHPQKELPDSLPRFDLLKDLPVDYCLITHAHQDHISSLPYLVQLFPYVKVITTPQTRAIAEVTLHNTVTILAGGLNNKQSLNPYTHEEIDLLIKSIDYQPYNTPFFIKGYSYNSPEIEITFFDAGHILGAAAISLNRDGYKIFYTGDINFRDQAVIRKSELNINDIDTIICETTYGSTDSSEIKDWHEESIRFAKEVNKIFVNGGSVLVPVFSLGKMQEMLKTIWDLMLGNKIPHTDIYYGGVSEKLTRIYDYNKYVVNRNNPDFDLRTIPHKNLYDVSDPNDFFKDPCIVLASSGMMLPGTSSFTLSRHWLNQKCSAIFIVGYMEETTPGFRIANADKFVYLTDNSDPIEVRCNIKKFKFPSHALREDLIHFVKKLKPSNVILVHGEKLSIDWIGSALLKENKNIKVYAAGLSSKITLE